MALELERRELDIVVEIRSLLRDHDDSYGTMLRLVVDVLVAPRKTEAVDGWTDHHKFVRGILLESFRKKVKAYDPESVRYVGEA